MIGRKPREYISTVAKSHKRKNTSRPFALGQCGMQTSEEIRTCVRRLLLLCSVVGVWMTDLVLNTSFLMNRGMRYWTGLKKYLVRPRYRLRSRSSLYQLHESFSNDFSIRPSFHQHLDYIVDTSTLQQKFPYEMRIRISLIEITTVMRRVANTHAPQELFD